MNKSVFPLLISSSILPFLINNDPSKVEGVRTSEVSYHVSIAKEDTTDQTAISFYPKEEPLQPFSIARPKVIFEVPRNQIKKIPVRLNSNPSSCSYLGTLYGGISGNLIIGYRKHP